MKRAAIFLLSLFFVFHANADSIAFFYALDSDLTALKKNAREVGQAVVIGTRRIQRLALGPHTVYAVKMGSGSVETALSAQALLSRFRCDRAFSLGPAGALADDLEVGRWYRVARVVAYQRGAGAALPESASWTTDWSQWPAHASADAVLRTNELSVASGELFVATASGRERIAAQSSADSVDMNSFGLAVACADHGVPLFSWKIVSDRADEDAAADFRAFLNAYRGEGGTALAALITDLPASLEDPRSYPVLRELIDGATAAPSPAE